MMCAVAKDSRSEPGAVCSQVSVCAGRGGGVLAVSTCSVICVTPLPILCIFCVPLMHIVCVGNQLL